MAPSEVFPARVVRVVARIAWYQTLRLRVRWSHWSLDEKLAAGVDPATDPALILRAAQLGSARNRRRLSAWLERLVKDSDAAPPTFSAAVPTARDQVLEARGSLLFLAHLLRDAERLRPRGIAMVQRLLTDGGSVLYMESARGVVELHAQSAIDRLVGERDATPEAWFSISNENSRDVVESGI